MLTLVKWFGLASAALAVGAYAVLVVMDWPNKPLDAAARSTAPGMFLDIDGDLLHYRWDGPANGPVVVLVHGFSTPSFIFDQNVLALTQAGYRVLRYDHFGRGWSDRPRRAYTADFYDATLLTLLDRLGLDTPVRLAGLSMGGLIASEFTARHPDRVARLFLFVPAGLTLKGGQGGWVRQALGWPVVGDVLWRLQWRAGLLADPQYAADAALPPENRLAGDVTVQMQYRGYGPALLSTLRHMPMSGQGQVFDRLAATDRPVVAIFGGADATIDPSSAVALADHVPQAQIRIIGPAGHGLNYQNHKIVNPWLVSWAESATLE